MRRPFVLAILLAAACGGGTAPDLDLTPAEAQRLIEVQSGNPAFVVLDVRTEAEYAGGHLDRALLLDCLDPAFEDDLCLLPKDGIYLVYCAAGGRSAAVVGRMRELGFRAAYDLLGGFTEWVAAGYPWTTL